MSTSACVYMAPKYLWTSGPVQLTGKTLYQTSLSVLADIADTVECGV